MPRPQPVALALHTTAAYIMYRGFTAVDGQVDEWIRSQKGQHLQFLTFHG